jgi:hypothetical protein
MAQIGTALVQDQSMPPPDGPPCCIDPGHRRGRDGGVDRRDVGRWLANGRRADGPERSLKVALTVGLPHASLANLFRDVVQNHGRQTPKAE